MNADKDTHIRKEHFIKAIRFSLNRDPMDGLSAIVESENVCDEESSSSSSNDHYELKGCFEKNFLQEKVAEQLADSIIDNAWHKTGFSPSAARQKFIENAAENFDAGTWKSFVEKTMVHCDKEYNNEISPFFRQQSDSVNFLDCMMTEIEDQRDGLTESYFEHCRNEFYSEWSLHDEMHLRELAEETQVPLEILKHCADFNYEILEKYRPIKENQTFLESFGAKIWERGE
jgi:hypothetical protein